jgi:putative ABC transport system permease protein
VGARPWHGVTANLLELLSVTPALGRRFAAIEDAPGTRPVAIISHAMWQRRFGGSRDAIGSTLTLDDRALEIVGILPSDFSFLTFPGETDVWLPLGADPFDGRRFARGARSMGVLGRLRADTSLASVRGEIDAIAGSLAAAYPRFNTGRRIIVVPLRAQVSRGVRDGALVLLAAVGCVLLIGCANVAGLLLARGAARQRELTIRAALGASRQRLLRFQLAESFVLAAMGGAAGLLLAVWLLDLLVTLPVRTDSLFVPYSVPRSSIQLDPLALAFTAAITALTAVLFGLLPAWPAARIAATDDAGLRAGMRSTTGRRQHRARAGLVVAEVAIAVTLLVSAGLLLRAFARVSSTDPGFRSNGILAMDIALSRVAYARPERAATFFSESLARLSALPGVQQAAVVEYLPMSGLDSSSGFYIEGRAIPDRADEQQTHFRSVSSGYFSALGIAVVSGRAFSERDGALAPRVAIINETMARRYWPGENAVGKRLALDLEAMKFFPDRPPTIDIPSGMREIVGIVRDIRHESLNAAATPEMYMPFAQRPVTDMTLVLKTTGDVSALVPAARAALREVDPDQPVARVEALSNFVRNSVAQPRANSILLSGFAAVAVLLSVVGIYALLAYAVSQRTPELGIRLALGGQPSDILRMVLTDGARLVLAGVGIGIPAALLAGTTLRGLLFGIQPSDLPTLVTAVLLMLGVGLAACYLPAHRAMRVDPIAALRRE